MAVDVTSEPTQALKVLGEPLRWEIVQRLAVEDLCTCHLVDELGVAQPLISHHLRVLRQAGLVRSEPCGSFTYYILDRALLGSIADRLAAMAVESSGSPRRRPCA